MAWKGYPSSSYECWDDEEIPWPGPDESMTFTQILKAVSDVIFESFGNPLYATSRYIEYHRKYEGPMLKLNLEKFTTPRRSTVSYHAHGMSLDFHRIEINAESLAKFAKIYGKEHLSHLEEEVKRPPLPELTVKWKDVTWKGPRSKTPFMKRGRS